MSRAVGPSELREHGFEACSLARLILGTYDQESRVHNG